MTQIFILGNKISCIPSYDALYQLVETGLRNGHKGYITVNNVHTMMEGHKDGTYQHIINNGWMAIPDGKPLEIVGKLKGSKDVARLFGPSVMESFIDWSQEGGQSHFFFGTSEEKLLQLRNAIESKYPKAKIVGMLAPPFSPMQFWPNTQFMKAINEAQPDFIWIGLGAPKQERWMFEHSTELRKGFMFGVGAAFDYLAGTTQHAPQWMKNASLEWLFRLVQEPRRLWKRYLTTIPPFILLASTELIREQLFKKNAFKS